MKLKSTQLRRYNKVLHNGIEKTIECIGPAYIMFREDCPDEKTFGEWVDLDEVEFIPLTEEWFLKFGFEELYDDGEFYKDEFHYMDEKLYFYTSSIPIEYVHQLQNLYFALTGEELQLNKNSLY